MYAMQSFLQVFIVLKLKSQDLAPGQGPDEGLVQGMYSVHVQ